MNSNSDSKGFAELGLGPMLLAVLTELGYEEPTAIQRQAIPPLIEGRDVLGQAATGTGKTAAFALPLLQRLENREQRPTPMSLVLVPTRELAMQVAEAMYRYGRGVGARVLPVYGGQPIGRQLGALKRGVDVVIATPGRALDHIRRGTLRLSGLEAVVLDEADEMLDMGFAEDIETILADTPAECQRLLFSATMPARISAIAKRHLKDPVKIMIAHEAAARGDAPKVRQTAYIVPRAHKAATLGRVLDMESPAAAIVFCRTRLEVDELTPSLAARGYGAEALHGGMDQDQRDRVMGRLRSGAIDLLVATDVAARGLDIEQLTHVVNYDVPSAPDAYVHRIGRVGRAGREGVAITLCEPREHRLLRNIERVTRQRIHVDKVPTVADLIARRLDLTRAALRESLLEGKLDNYRGVVEALTDEFDVMEVALAAVKLADENSRPAADEREIPQVKPPREDVTAGGRPRRPERGGRTEGGPKRDRRGGPRMTRVFVNAGREAGIRPQDLVGAIANEARIDARQIGAIEIADRFSLVEVSEGVAEDVIRTLRGTAVRGRKVNVRRERYER